MSTATLFYFSLGSFALIIIMTGVMFVRYQLLYLRLLEEGALPADEGGEPSEPMAQLRMAPPQPDVAIPAATPPAPPPAVAKPVPAVAKAAPVAAPASPAAAEDQQWDRKLRTAILAQATPAELILREPKQDDSDETGRWFVENREVLERLHSQLRGHKTSSGRRKASLVQAAKSLAERVGIGKESPAKPPPKAPPSASAVKAENADGREQKAPAPAKRPTLLVKHSSMAEKIKHDNEAAEAPPPAGPVEVRQPKSSAAAPAAEPQKKKRPTLLVKHKPGEIPLPPPVSDDDDSDRA